MRLCLVFPICSNFGLVSVNLKSRLQAAVLEGAVVPTATCFKIWINPKKPFLLILMITSKDKEKMEIHAFERELRNIADITDDKITKKISWKHPHFHVAITPRGFSHVWR